MSHSLRRLIVAVITVGIVLIGLVPASLAVGQTVSRHHANQYNKAYRAVARKDGKRAPGRNILGDGYRAKSGVRAPTDSEVVKCSRRCWHHRRHRLPLQWSRRKLPRLRRRPQARQPARARAATPAFLACPQDSRRAWLRANHRTVPAVQTSTGSSRRAATTSQE